MENKIKKCKIFISILSVCFVTIFAVTLFFLIKYLVIKSSCNIEDGCKLGLTSLYLVFAYIGIAFDTMLFVPLAISIHKYKKLK